jgi:hypothetical protein
MGDMENVGLLLVGKMKKTRLWRHQLLQFLDALSLYLQAGYDLAYGWPETHRALEAELCPALAKELRAAGGVDGEGILALLSRLALSYPEAGHRLWFSVLKELYASGAGLGDAVRAMANSLRQEHYRDLDAHCRNLPTKINVLVLLFFLPPALLLLFTPLILEILRSF